jgi:Zn-dependent protease
MVFWQETAMGQEQQTGIGAGYLRWAVRLFRVGGVDVVFHWPWLWLPCFLLPLVQPAEFTSWLWYVPATLSLAGLILLHEAGHLLACRLVGGRAWRIALWCGGGLTAMALPRRPGAWLAVMLAGPAVSGGLALAALLAWGSGPAGAENDLGLLLQTAVRLNLIVLGFSLLPIYPLDGGQVLHAILWRWRGWARGLLLTGVVSLVVLLVGLVLAWWFCGWAALGVGVMTAINWSIEAGPLWRLVALDPAWFDKDHDRAVAAATDVLEWDPGHAWAYFVRAEAHRHRGETERASADYHEAIRLRPDDTASQQRLAELGRPCPVTES